jgi:hypothetical protein
MAGMLEWLTTGRRTRLSGFRHAGRHSAAARPCWPPRHHGLQVFRPLRECGGLLGQVCRPVIDTSHARPAPPTIIINGDKPAIIHVGDIYIGDTYNDLSRFYADPRARQRAPLSFFGREKMKRRRGSIQVLRFSSKLSRFRPGIGFPLTSVARFFRQTFCFAAISSGPPARGLVAQPFRSICLCGGF